MTNKIALKYDTVSLVLSIMKLGTPQKAHIYNESKNVSGKSLRFVFSDPRAALAIPAYRKNSLFISTG